MEVRATGPEWLMSRAPGPLTLHDYLIPGDGAQCFRPVLVRRRGLGGDAALSTCVRMRKKYVARRATVCSVAHHEMGALIIRTWMVVCECWIPVCLVPSGLVLACIFPGWLNPSCMLFHECFNMIWRFASSIGSVQFYTFKSCKLIVRLILRVMN